MPSISEFRGVKIEMYYNDNERHHRPHFHAYYGERSGTYDIIILRPIESGLPAVIESYVIEWAARNRRQLKKNWYRAK